MEERNALSHLKANQDIVIKHADKGSKIVIMDKKSIFDRSSQRIK